MKHFGIAPSTAHGLVAEVYDLILASYSRVDLKRLGAILINRYDYIYAKACAASDLKAMIASTDSVARFYLAAVKDYEAAAPQPYQQASVEHDPEEDF